MLKLHAALVRGLCNTKRGAIAKQIGRDAKTITSWLNGETSIRLEDLNKLAKALNVRPMDLLIEEES